MSEFYEDIYVEELKMKDLILTKKNDKELIYEERIDNLYKYIGKLVGENFELEQKLKEKSIQNEFYFVFSIYLFHLIHLHNKSITLNFNQEVDDYFLDFKKYFNIYSSSIKPINDKKIFDETNEKLSNLISFDENINELYLELD